MPSQSRKDDQEVDAFSAPKSLLALAKTRAASRGMTKSGFYRYCLAKECGFSEEQALAFSVHRAVVNSVQNRQSQSQSQSQSSVLNESSPVYNPSDSLADKVLRMDQKPRKKPIEESQL